MPELCMTVEGFFDDRSAQRLEHRQRQKLLGPLSQLPEFIKNNNIDVIFIALPLRHIRRVQDLIDALGDTTVSLYYVPDVLDSNQFQARVGEILGVPVIALRESPFYGYQGAAKRLMDIVSRCARPDRRRAGVAVDRAGDPAHQQRPGVVPPAPLRVGRPGNRDLQVPHHDGDGGCRLGRSGETGRREGHAARTFPAALFAR